LDDLIIRIGRMITYQEYNTKSPLNGLAAKWAAQNSHLLPVDPRPIAPPLETETVHADPEQSSPPLPLEPTNTQAASAVSSTPRPVSASQNAAAGIGEDPWTQKIVIP
jgi:hypothetical protein